MAPGRGDELDGVMPYGVLDVDVLDCLLHGEEALAVEHLCDGLLLVSAAQTSRDHIPLLCGGGIYEGEQRQETIQRNIRERISGVMLYRISGGQDGEESRQGTGRRLDGGLSFLPRRES